MQRSLRDFLNLFLSWPQFYNAWHLEQRHSFSTFTCIDFSCQKEISRHFWAAVFNFGRSPDEDCPIPIIVWNTAVVVMWAVFYAYAPGLSRPCKLMCGKIFLMICFDLYFEVTYIDICYKLCKWFKLTIPHCGDFLLLYWPVLFCTNRSLLHNEATKGI